MTIRLSDGLRNALNEEGSLKRVLSNGWLSVYSGTQPASANHAYTGTLLCKYTLASGAHTPEVRSAGSVTIAGASGSIDTITLAVGGGTAFDILGGSVAFSGDINITATAVAAAINNNPANIYVNASTTGASGVITLTGKRGVGATANGWVPAGTGTTLTVGTPVNLTGGVTAVNGLRFGDSAAGKLVKHPDQVWSGVASFTGTAGWFRFAGAVADAQAADAAELYLRMDGSIGTSGADLVLSNTTITAFATETLLEWSLTEPAQ